MQDVRRDALDLIVSSLYDPEIELQALAAEGYAKLFLHRVIADGSVLIGLLQLYFHPATAENARLRQTLTYFLQAFAYSSSSNQVLLAECVVSLLDGLLPMQESLKITLLQAGSQLIELCDPANLIGQAIRGDSAQHGHAHLAEQLAWACLGSIDEAPRLRLLCQLLNKLYLNNEWPPYSIKRLLLVLGQLIRVLPACEKIAVAGVKKLVTSLVELDDSAYQLDLDELNAIRIRLQNAFVNPPQQLPVAAPKKKYAGAAAAKPPSQLATTNVMDEISDLLDD